MTDDVALESARLRPVPRRLVWLLGPLIAVIVILVLVRLVPASGPMIEVSWRNTLPVAQRQTLERRLHLVNPTYLEGTRWGYVLDDASQSNLWMLAHLPTITGVRFIGENPLRSTGPLIIRLEGPYAVQSFICFALGLLVLTGSFAPTRGWRQSYFACACALFVVGWIACELPLRASHELANWMGDYNTYTEDREHFEAYFGYEVARFHFHLGGYVLNLVDRALGATDSSPQTAFLVTSWLMGGVFLMGALIVAVVEGWSAHVMRYLSLSLAAPVMLFFFGYRELGYFSLSIAAFPLLLRGLMSDGETSRITYLAGTGALHGVRAALHGFGLVSLGAALVATVFSKASLRSRLENASTVFLWGFTAYLIWLVGYFLVLGVSVAPGHATGIPFRHLLDEYVAASRMVAPIVSARGFRELGLESIMVGVPILALGFLVGRGSGERRIAAGYAAVSVAFLLLFWPAQGPAADADLVVAAFSAFFPGAWLCARSTKATALGFAFLALAHAAFWFVVRHAEFVNQRLDV